MSRREYLRSLLALSGFLPAPVLLAVPVETPGRRMSLSALAPYLDILIPEDSTPSASQLGVDQAIIAVIHDERRLTRLVGLGCAWLDEQARTRGAARFSALSEAGREALVTLAEQAPAQSLPRAFFAFTRRQAFLHYYAQPAAWAGLGFSGPPQPHGFPDFAQPPSVPTL